MSKRSRERKHFYAISRGRCPPCITSSWTYASNQVVWSPNNRYKGFATFKLAKDWLLKEIPIQEDGCKTFHFMQGPMDDKKSPTSENNGRPAAYSIANGRKPGVYYNYPDVQAQVDGYSGATYKSHATKEAAYASLESVEPQLWSQRHPIDSDEGFEDEETDNLTMMMTRTMLWN